MVSLFATGALLDSIDVPTSHHNAHLDAYGDYQEGGATRAGFLSALVSIGVGIWSGIAFYARRLDAGLPAAEWRKLGYGLAALAAYTMAMTLLTVTFERETRDIPDFLFTIADWLILLGICIAAYKLHWRADRK